MSASTIARKVMRDVRNRWSYQEVENFVRDATSNTNDPPSPAQIRQIGDSMLYYESYPKAFAMLWRRLTHLEYKRHVAKSLLVLDNLVRIRPPSKAVQLRLMVDIRERWPEIWRLAQLRPSSSSETIAQIQRVAERLCQFIMGYESGYILPEETEEDEEEEEDIESRRRRRQKSRRRKRRTTVDEEEVEDGDGDDDGADSDHEGAEDDHDEGKADIARSVSSSASSQPAKPAMPPVSPFGFDFFTHTNFEWQPAPSAAPPQTQSAQQKGWACPACTFINPDDKEKCEICGGDKHSAMDEKDNDSHSHAEEKADDDEHTWACEACSFRNREEAEQCEVCETRRGAKVGAVETGEGMEGTQRGREGAEGEGKEGDGIGDEKEGFSDLSVSSLSSISNSSGSGSGESTTGGSGSQLPGAWACSYCSWLNPPTAVICEVCEREGKRSGMAQLVKLEMARKHEESQAGGTETAGRQARAWACTVCTFVNPATRTECAACGAHSPYAAELALTGGAGSAYNSAVASPQLSPRSQSRRASQRLPSSLAPPQYTEQAGETQQQSQQRSTGYAIGYSDRSQRRLSGDEAKDDSEISGGAELLDAVKSQENELAHQMAALQHYNKQKEMYRQQHGWTCSACSFLNDPHASRCEICDNPRPGGQDVAAQSSSQPMPSQSQSQSQTQSQLPSQQQQQRLTVSPASSQPAPVLQQRAPSLPASSPSPPVATLIAKSAVQPAAQRASPPVSQATSIQPQSSARPSIPSSSPIQPSPSSSSSLQQPSLPASKPPSTSSTSSMPTSPLVSASSRELSPTMQRSGSVNQLQQQQPRHQQQQQPSSKSPLATTTPSAQQSLVSPNLPSSAPVQRAVSSGPTSPPSAVPVINDWPTWTCDICTYRNSWGDDKCLMCMAPKPLTVPANQQSQNATVELPATLPSTSPAPLPSAAVPSSGPAGTNAPPIPATGPNVPSNSRRATQPLPSSRPALSNIPSPPAGRLSVLDGVPGSFERGPAPVPGGDAVRFPAQFQQQQMQQAMYQQEMARQQAIRQQMALQAQQQAQQMAAMSAAQQLAALTPLSQQSPPSQQRQQLQQHEDWLRKQHEERQQLLAKEQQQRAAEQRKKGSLDILIDEHFKPGRREDAPVELPPASPTPPLSGRVSPAPGQMYPLNSPPINARSLSNSSSAPPGTAPTQFHSMFDQAAQGFAQDFMGRRASHDHITVQTAPPRASTPNPSHVVPASPSPSPVPGAPADINTESPKSARSDTAAKPRRDRSPVKREARPSLPLDQLKMPFSVQSSAPTPSTVTVAPSLPSPPRTAAQPQPPVPAPAIPSSTPAVSHQRVDSWDVKAAAAAAQGRQITPFDTPQSTPQAAHNSSAPFDFATSQPATAASVQLVGQRAGEGIVRFSGTSERGGDGDQPRRVSGEGEADDGESAWSRRPGYVHDEPQPQSQKQSLSPKKRLFEKLSPPTVPVALPIVAPPPKRPISDEAKGSISALAAALAASAAQQASVKATQSPAAEARQLAAAAALVPSLPVPELPKPQPAPAHVPAQPIKSTPPTVPPHPDKAKTLALQLPRSDSGSITRPGDEPSTPVSTNRSSSTTRSRSPSSQEYKADMREKVRAEILSTEQFYVDALNDLIKYYMQPLQRLGPKMHVEPRHVSAIFQNLTVLQQFHSIFLDDLQRNRNTAAVFVQFADFLKMYTQYVAGYEKSIATINSLRQNKAFQHFMESTRDQLKGRGIMTYLIMPVQRIPRYVLLLRELKKFTGADHPEMEALSVALTKIESIGTHINESKRQVEQMSKLLDIQNRLRNKEFVIFKPDRRLLREGFIRRLREEYVLERSREEPHASDVDDMLLFLFNDLLLWTTKDFDIAGHVPLDTLLCLPDGGSFKLPFTLTLGIRGKPYSPDMIFACKDQQEKDEWSRYILSAINTATDPTRQRKPANSATLGSGQTNRPMVAVSRSGSQSLVGADSSDADGMYDPPSRNSYSTTSRNSASSQLTASQYPLPPQHTQPAPLSSAAASTLPLPTVSSAIPASSQPVGSTSTGFHPTLSSSALLLQVLHPSAAAPSSSSGSNGPAGVQLSQSIPPPLLSSTLHSSAAPPPMLSALNHAGKQPSQPPH